MWTGLDLIVGNSDTTGWARAFAARYLVVIAVLAAAVGAAAELAARSDRRIGSQLGQRVSRGRQVSPAMMLGPARVAFVLTAATLHALAAVALLALHADWLGFGYLAGFGGALGLVWLGLARAVRRPTVAVDRDSLAIDERLRAQDAFAAAQPLYGLLYAFPLSLVIAVAPAWLAVAWFGGFLVLNALWALGVQRPPWRRPPARGGGPGRLRTAGSAAR